VIVALVSLAILLLWEQPVVKRVRASLWIQGPLVAVAAGMALNAAFLTLAPGLVIAPSHLVQLPVLDSLANVGSLFTLPDFSQLGNPAIYTTALTLAVVASLETLLCVEATDRLDPLKRVTPTDRELKAQGLGNVVSGLIGGLPITQVIVRSSANIQSGARTKMAAVLHGVFLLVAALLMPAVLNLTPLATLAAVLLMVGYKLAKPALFAEMYRHGWEQFLPFAVTIAGILATDLLVGIGLGMGVAVFMILLTNYRNPYSLVTRAHKPGEVFRLELSEDVSFLNRAAILRTLDAIPPGSRVEIDATRSVHIDHDVFEILRDFEQKAALNDIALTMSGLEAAKERTDAMRDVGRVLRRERNRVARQGELAASLGR
jgi:MFS superfamily sulfate permease-like transporter